MKAKCNKNLFMHDGKKCFTKGKTYPVYEYGSEFIKMFDDQKAPHAVWDVPDGWFKHFTLITEITR